MLEDALRHERSLHMLRPTSPLVFACTMVLQLSEPDNPARNFILRIALRCAGEPKGEIMTYAKHNGFQILNMLWWVHCGRSACQLTFSLTKDTAEIRRSPTSPRTASSMVYPSPSLQQTLMPNNTVYNPAPMANQVDMSGTGWADLDQLLGYSGNVDFPYFPGEVTNMPAVAPNIDTGSVQWNDIFNNLTNANGWNTGDGGFMDVNSLHPQADDWTATLPGSGNGDCHDHVNGSDQTQAGHRVNDFYHHVASAHGN